MNKYYIISSYMSLYVSVHKNVTCPSSEYTCTLIKFSHLVIICQLHKIHNFTCFSLSWQRYIYKDRKPEHIIFNSLLAWLDFWASIGVLSHAMLGTRLKLITVIIRRSCATFYYLTLRWVKWAWNHAGYKKDEQL